MSATIGPIFWGIAADLAQAFGMPLPWVSNLFGAQSSVHHEFSEAHRVGQTPDQFLIEKGSVAIDKGPSRLSVDYYAERNMTGNGGWRLDIGRRTDKVHEVIETTVTSKGNLQLTRNVRQGNQTILLGASTYRYQDGGVWSLLDDLHYAEPGQGAFPYGQSGGFGSVFSHSGSPHDTVSVHQLVRTSGSNAGIRTVTWETQAGPKITYRLKAPELVVLGGVPERQVERIVEGALAIEAETVYVGEKKTLFRLGRGQLFAGLVVLALFIWTFNNWFEGQEKEA